jgi:hypothetical protein
MLEGMGMMVMEGEAEAEDIMAAVDIVGMEGTAGAEEGSLEGIEEEEVVVVGELLTLLEMMGDVLGLTMGQRRRWWWRRMLKGGALRMWWLEAMSGSAWAWMS